MSDTNYAKLVDKKVVPVGDLKEWAEFFERENRHVDDTKLPHGVRVSTVFLGLNHGFAGRDLWFETMIFGGPHDGCQERYETYDQAVAGHKIVVKLARGESEKV